LITALLQWLDYTNETEALPVVLDHEAFSSYWGSQDMTNKWNNVRAPAVHFAAWYDLFLQSQLDAYRGYQQNSTVAGYNYLIISPGGHCEGGAVCFNVTVLLTNI
jgi:predicted acyl esterase